MNIPSTFHRKSIDILSAPMDFPPAAMGAPVARLGHTAVWAGSEMVVWGGRAELSDSDVFDDTFGYTPARTMFLYLKP
jgi:hypothetical protein